MAVERSIGARSNLPFALALTPFLGCSEPSPADSGVEHWLELGTGETEFVSLEDGDEVPLVYGPQGGWHIDATARFGGIELDGAWLTYVATDPDDGAVLNYPYEAKLHPSLLQEIEDGWLRVGDRAVFAIETDEEILGRTVQLEVTLTDGTGGHHHDQRVIVVVSP